MATTAGTARTRLLSRVRMSGTVAYSEANIYDLLSKCEMLINYLIGRYTATDTITTSANTYFYTFSADLSDGMRIVSMSESNREIPELPDWRELGQFSRTWLDDTGTRFECFAHIGHDLILIYPAKTGASSVDVTYVKIPATLDDSADNFSLPDDDVELVIDLAEIILLTSSRRFAEAKRKMETFSKTLLGYFQ